MVLHGPFDNLSHGSESFPVGPAGPEDLGGMRLFIKLKRECAHRTDAMGRGVEGDAWAALRCRGKHEIGQLGYPWSLSGVMSMTSESNAGT